MFVCYLPRWLHVTARHLWQYYGFNDWIIKSAKSRTWYQHWSFFIPAPYLSISIQLYVNVVFTFIIHPTVCQRGYELRDVKLKTDCYCCSGQNVSMKFLPELLFVWFNRTVQDRELMRRFQGIQLRLIFSIDTFLTHTVMVVVPPQSWAAGLSLLCAATPSGSFRRFGNSTPGSCSFMQWGRVKRSVRKKCVINALLQHCALLCFISEGYQCTGDLTFMSATSRVKCSIFKSSLIELF